jgi:hypothetical protein
MTPATRLGTIWPLPNKPSRRARNRLIMICLPFSSTGQLQLLYLRGAGQARYFGKKSQEMKSEAVLTLYDMIFKLK